MKDRDAKILEEAFDDVYGSRGEYIIKIQLLENTDKGGMLVEEAVIDKVSGDEAAWNAFVQIRDSLKSERSSEDEI